MTAVGRAGDREWRVVDLDDAAAALAQLREVGDDLSRFLLCYKFAIDEITTKIQILREEFRHSHAYNPIENVTSRLKTPESVVAKARRRGCALDLATVREEIRDIAGVRVTCSFVSDVYRVFDMLSGQQDVRLVTVKDYVAHPKPNGYRSLHAIVEIPVFLSSGPVPTYVELQIRTIAMDFWASLEHKTYYKYEGHVPDDLLDELREAAETAARLDADMERLHHRIHPAG